MTELSKSEIKELWYQCRFGFIFPALLIIIINVGLFAIIFTNGYSYHDMEIIGIIILTALLCVLIGFLLTRKYISDIRNKVKIKEQKTITLKESKTDQEAGSATLFVNQSMNEFIRYDIIVENCRYRVEKEFFDNCKIGDEVYFNYAPLSKYLLSIELKDFPAAKSQNNPR